METLGRRGFFGIIGAMIASKEARVRPPYAAEPARFATACPQCDAPCGGVCKEKILKIGEDRLPFLDFMESGCSDCRRCLEVCEPGVLNAPERFIAATVRINALKCMSWSNVMCYACKEPCMENAIIFSGLFRPEVVSDACSGCGYCISRCPGGAIEVVA